MNKSEEQKAKAKRRKWWLIFTGIYFFPLFFICICLIVNFYIKVAELRVRLSLYGYFVVAIVTLMFCAVICIRNIYEYIVYGKRVFSSVFGYLLEKRYSIKRRIAMYPVIEDDLLFKNPTGLVLGSVGWGRFRRYICIDTWNRQISSHLAVSGNTGSGKSSGLILTSVISNFMRDNDDVPPEQTFLLVDVKPEIYELSTSNSKYSRVLNPKSRGTWGWDAYYQLTDTSSEDELFDVIESIVDVLVPEATEQNMFFVNSARNVLCALLMFEYICNHRNFISSIRHLMSISIAEYISQIKDIVNERHKIYMLLSDYGKHDKSNAYEDIKKTIKENLKAFIRDDVDWFMDTQINKRVCSPRDLENGISLFLSIPRSDLEKYGVIFRLIISQCLDSLSRRKENDSNLRPIVFIIDEFTNLGAKIPRYTENLGFIRSKKVTCVTIFQQYSELQRLYGKESAKTILNMGHLLILSCEDNDFAHVLSEKAGEFEEKKVEYKTKGFGIFKTKLDTVSVSTRKEKRVRVMDDLSSLLPRFEAIAFIHGSTYYRFSKCRYYFIPELKKRAKECREYHRIIEDGYIQEDTE